MLLVALLGCSMAMLRPAHSLGPLEGSANLGIAVDPELDLDLGGCLDPDPGSACAPGLVSPVDFEYRLGLGHGFELGVRGLLPPRSLLVRYAVLDERRHPTAGSVALSAEAGAQLGIGAAGVELEPFVHADLLLSGTLRPGAAVQLRPAASLGWWIEPRGHVILDAGPGFTVGVFVPIRIPAGLGLAPVAGVAGWLPLGRVPEVQARLGLQVEPWLEPGRDRK